VVTDIRAIVEALVRERVDYVIIGAVALIAHGGSRVTVDLDLCYGRDQENLERLARGVVPFHPRLRGAPPELPFFFDSRTLRSGLNFTLTTDAGDLDLLGEVAGVGGYAECRADAASISLYGHDVAILGLDTLERSKRAAGRAKDLLDLAEIAVLKRRKLTP
jgi:hypothetical protein